MAKPPEIASDAPSATQILLVWPDCISAFQCMTAKSPAEPLLRPTQSRARRISRNRASPQRWERGRSFDSAAHTAPGWTWIDWVQWRTLD